MRLQRGTKLWIIHSCLDIIFENAVLSLLNTSQPKKYGTKLVCMKQAYYSSESDSVSELGSYQSNNVTLTVIRLWAGVKLPAVILLLIF